MEDPRESRVEKNDTIGHVAYFEFKISPEDLAEDNQILIYSIGENGTRQLQFTRQIQADTFRINYQDTASRNEIVFSGNYPWIEEVQKLRHRGKAVAQDAVRR